MKEFLWTICDARIHVAYLAILIHMTQDVSHCALTIGASHYVITFYYTDVVISEVRLFHEDYNTIKDMFWHCQPLFGVLVSSPNASRIKNSLLFDINWCIWCVRLYGGCSRKRSSASALAIAKVVPKCLTRGDIGSKGPIPISEAHKEQPLGIYTRATESYSECWEPWLHTVLSMTPSENEGIGRERVAYFCTMA